MGEYFVKRPLKRPPVHPGEILREDVFACQGYQLKPGQFVNSTGYLRMIFYPFLPVVSHPSGLLSIQTGLESLSQIIVQMLLFHRVSLGQNYE